MANDLSRRQFLTHTGMAAAALAVGRLPSFGATGKQNPPLVLGSGSNKYECHHDWLFPPDNIKWGDTHGVAQDAKGLIYVAHTVHPSSQSPDAIVVFDPHGKFVKSWGGRFRGGAHGLALRKEGHHEFLYHCDIAHRVVVKTDLDGNVIWEKGTPHEPGVYEKGEPFVPTNVAFHPDGGFYVADGYGSGYIHEYDKNANWVRTFGGTGTDPGKMQTPHGLWVDPRGHAPLLAVSDRENHRLQYLTLDGKFVRFDTDGMRRPCNCYFRHDTLLVPDLRSVVTLLDRDNKVIEMLGDGDPSNLRDQPRDKFINGKFVHPHHAIFLHNGDILVAEWVPIGRVTLLKKVA